MAHWSFTILREYFSFTTGSARTNFQSVAGSTPRAATYTSGSALRNARGSVAARMVLLVLKSGAHWASEPLISNEQFPLGGTEGVRGYEEGENYSDAGWRADAGFAQRRPSTSGRFPLAKGRSPAFVRPSVFLDYGEGYQLDRPGVRHGAPIGRRARGILRRGRHFEARLTLGWALLHTPIDAPRRDFRRISAWETQF